MKLDIASNKNNQIDKFLGLCFFYFLGMMLFFPSITFKLVPAEVFPWALIFTILFYRKISKYALVSIFIILLSALISALIYLEASETLRSTAAYFNSLLIFYTVISLDDRKRNLLAVYGGSLLFFMLFFALLQKYSLLSWLQSLFDMLMHRGKLESFSELRGVSGFSSEPAREAFQVVCLLMLIKCRFALKPFLMVCLELIVFIFIMFIYKSFIGLLVFVIYFGAFYSRYFIKATALGMLIVVLALLNKDNFSNFIGSSRALSILFKLVEFNDFKSLFNFISDLSGFRLVSIISAYEYSVINLFGGGVGQWKATSIEALTILEVPPEAISYFDKCYGFCPVRPASYVSSLLLDLGAILTLVILFPVFRIVLKNGEKNIKIAGYVFVVFLFLFAEPGNPLPWLVAALIITKKEV
jgi:hypothetical protein